MDLFKAKNPLFVINKLREKMSNSEAKKDIFYVTKKSKYATKKTKYVNFRINIKP